MNRVSRIVLPALLAFIGPAVAWAVPLPIERKEATITDASSLVPARKHLPLPGKIVAVLVKDAQPVLSTEGRSGPPDQLCIGWNGGSYRWVYVPTDGKELITNLLVPLPEGRTRVYPKLNMATPETVRPWGVDAPYSLVEVEVNDGAGSPAEDAFVATRMIKLDGTKEFPFKTVEVVERLKREYDTRLSEKQKDYDAAMNTAARKAIKDRPPTGPREAATLMFLTWMPDKETLCVRFLTKITDGDYKYANGIRIELNPPPPEAPAKGGSLPPRRLENGLRYGTQFGIETGVEYLVNKSGKVDAMRVMEPKEFLKKLPAPPLGKGPVRKRGIEGDKPRP